MVSLFWDTLLRCLQHLSCGQLDKIIVKFDDNDNDGVDELHLAPVMSTRAHAQLLSVDPSEALTMTGVVDFVSYKDVPANNNYASCTGDMDKTVFAKDTVSVSVSLNERLLTFNLQSLITPTCLSYSPDYRRRHGVAHQFDVGRPMSSYEENVPVHFTSSQENRIKRVYARPDGRCDMRPSRITD